MLIFIFLLLLLSVSQQAVNYHKAFTTSGHTDLVTTVSFFNDNLRMVTGSNDYTVKIWDLTNYTLITQLNFSDYIMNVAIHPTDNRIFVLVYDGTIAVHDGTTYLLITSFTYPTTNGNYMVIDPINDKFYVGGYEGAGIAPEIYVYSCTSYALLSQFTTTLPTGDQINTLSLNQGYTQLSVTNLATTGTIYQLQIYHLNNFTLIGTFNDHTDKIRWAIFDNVGNYICSTSRDQSIRCYRYQTSNSTYMLDEMWTVTGYPYCLNYGVTDTIIVTVNQSIVFFNRTTSPPTSYHIYPDMEPIFVLDSSPNMDYLVTGMETGNVSVWEVVPPPTPPTPPPNPTPNPTPNPMPTIQSQTNIPLIVGLSVGLSLLFAIIITIISCCFCSCCIKYRKKWRTSPQQQPSAHKIKSQNEKQTQYYIIRQNKNQKSDKSSDIDYDELMAQGTIIIIKDKDKKQKYLKKLHKKQNDNNMSQIDPTSLDIQGNIIIIRDDEHSIHKKKNKKIKQNDSDRSSQPDYQQLMAQGNIIIIKDQQPKKRFIKKLQQNHDPQDDYTYSQLLAQGNIIIIKDEIIQKKYIKQLKKQQQIEKIKYDQMLVDGTVLVIKDKDKKKQYVQNITKQLNKLKQPLNDIKLLQVAEQIIIIQGQDDIQQQLTYQQLLAQGTVIIIKDNDIAKQYNSYRLHKKQKHYQSKKQTGSNKSSQPDYKTLMAQQCIIIIKDENDKQQYINFLQKRQKIKNMSQRSSHIEYDQLINQNNVIMIEDNNNTKDELRKINNSTNMRNNTNNNIIMNPIHNPLMAEKNVIIIGQEQPQARNTQNNLTYINKSMPLKK